MRLMVLIALVAIIAAPGAVAAEALPDDSEVADGGPSCIKGTGAGVKISPSHCLKVGSALADIAS